ncbi:MAG: laccase domain-containing protein [Actinomycetota bacterium]|nr:laccase domain-containing protein [Actinomycetota bacterium]
MIRPAGFRGAAFGDAGDGNGRDDLDSRGVISDELGISRAWAFVHQVHGGVVLNVQEPGPAGSADGLITDLPGLPLAIATADCMPIIIEGDRSVAIVHAGWRGIAAGIIGAGIKAMRAFGDTPRRAAIGPSIGPCCYEVGDEVRAAVGDYSSRTTSGTPSVDLQAEAAIQLSDLDVWRSDICTNTDPGFRSYRRDATTERQVAVAWLPEG